MKQVQRFVVLALALLLVAVPAVTMAQTSSSPGGSSSGGASSGSEKSSGSSASPSTSGGTGASSGTGSAGQASPAMPASAEDCKNNGWQKLGLKSEAECVSKIKK
jgi:hypothetical protein